MKEQQQLTVAAIEARRNELSQQYDVAKRDRAVIALAVIEGDTQAAKRDEKLVAEALRLVDEIELTDAALVAARERERDAAAKRKAATDAAKGRHVLDKLEAFKARGKVLDEAALALARAFADFEADVSELARIGAGPNVELVHVNCRRALASLMMGTPLAFRHLAPNERTSFTALMNGWSRLIEAWARERLDQKAA